MTNQPSKLGAVRLRCCDGRATEDGARSAPGRPVSDVSDAAAGVWERLQALGPDVRAAHLAGSVTALVHAR